MVEEALAVGSTRLTPPAHHARAIHPYYFSRLVFSQLPSQFPKAAISQ